MKKNVLIVDREWDEIVHHEAIIDNDTGEVIAEAWDETVHKRTMKPATVDMTEEEEAEFLAQQANTPQPEPTAEERLAALESAMLEVILNG